jgi:ubiquinone/menaquinone biosynthesis C-methylase UbiE
MANRWNRFIYRMWAPVYDAVLGRLFMPGRKRASQLLSAKPGERVLIVGVGTGVDLLILPPGVEAVGIDDSPDMLAEARRKLPCVKASVELIQGDAQTSLVPDESFDAAILNLILSVVPDGRACLSAALRALKPGGRAVIFDKFIPAEHDLSPGRKLMNVFSTLFGTDITRRFSELAAGCDCITTHDEPSILRGTYRVMMIEKTQSAVRREPAGEAGPYR